MIQLKLRQAGLLVNYKRVERLYQEAKLQVRRRKRKKVLVAERQPLVRPTAANQVWSMDFLFARTADGRAIKCLTIVDDATHEAVSIEVERAISRLGVTRVLDRLALSCRLPQVNRTDSGIEFCCKAMMTRAFDRDVQLRLIRPGKSTRTLMSNRSTVGCAASASTSTGSPICRMPEPRSRPDGGNTTKNERRRRSAE